MSQPEFATLTADDQVTGEAVALDLPPAGLGVRMVSGLIDLVIAIVLLLVALFLALTASFRASEAVLTVALIGTSVTVLILMPVALETFLRGRTLGKLAMGLRTVRDDAGPITAQHAFIRTLVGFVEIYLFTGVPAFFSALLSSKGKRLGDYAAGTFVVRERVNLQLPHPPGMPDHLRSWAFHADMATLPTGLSLGIRQFLGRAPSLDPNARRSTALRLAEQVDPYVSPAPPPGTEPEDFLRAVLSSRRERDRARLERNAALRQRLTAPNQ